MMERTPGPWRFIRRDDGEGWIITEGVGGGALAVLPVDWRGHQPGNGALLAAAPELLEAAHRALEAFSAPFLSADAEIELRAAIAKAEGREDEDEL